ncbi:MAG: hypothetical protein IT299_10020 [Dehalococcoidia bacterium]|nr:hypothetical protein [Dehalococcoidia bacterium]
MVAASARSSPSATALSRHANSAGIILGAFALAWIAAFVWWWLLPPSKSVELAIPAGTAALVQAGEVPPGLPRELVVRRGDTLVVRNQDSEPHRLGPLWVAPATSETTMVSAAFFADGSLLCTIHPAGALAVTPRARPGIATTIPVALLAGVPMAFAGLVGAAIASRLDDGRGGSAG